MSSLSRDIYLTAMDLLSRPSLPISILLPSSSLDYTSIAVSIVAICCYASRGRLWDRVDDLEHLLYERPQLKHGGVVETRKESRNIRRKLDETVRVDFMLSVYQCTDFSIEGL